MSKVREFFARNSKAIGSAVGAAVAIAAYYNLDLQPAVDVVVALLAAFGITWLAPANAE